MSKAISFETICSDALHGVERAFKNYYKWSNGLWLDKAPESFIQTEIARSLSMSCPIITLEDTIDTILDDSYAKKRGRSPRGSSSGRVDIIVWWTSAEPRILVEVKKSWGTNCKGINSDATRIKQLLNRGGSLQKGFIIVYTDAKSADIIEKRFKNIAANSDTILYDWLTPKRRKEDGDYWFWSAACFVIDN